MKRTDAMEGCLLGCAVGDSLGLPTEGLSRRRAAKMLKSPLRQQLIGPYGMCSDDTEHLFFTAQALLKCHGEPEKFVRSLGRSLRMWFLALPAGVGLATAKACLKLCVGFPPTKSGVRSAGNGPAMRAPILGVYAAGDPKLQKTLVDASTRITHTDPDAITGAHLIAVLAGYLAEGMNQDDALDQLRLLPDLSPFWTERLELIQTGLTTEISVMRMAEQLGLVKGISGYICHTVPMVIYTVLRHPEDPMSGLEVLIAGGGDTDTTAAIAGALYGAKLGPDAFPEKVVSTIRNGPMSVRVMRKAGQALDRNELTPVSWAWLLVPFRNLFFLAVVLCHGFRRLLPPY